MWEDNEFKKILMDAMVNGLIVDCDLEELEETINAEMDPKYEIMWASPDETIRGCVIHDEEVMPCLIVRIDVETKHMSFSSPFLNKIHEGDKQYCHDLAFQFMHVLKAIQLTMGEMVIREKQYHQVGEESVTKNIDEDWIL